MKIRKSEMSDLPVIMSVLDEARDVMRANGNLNQWINGYPQECVIRNDIARGQSYVMESICQREDTLYSWKNTMIAMRNGQRAGILVSYDGARYRRMRDITFPIFLGNEDFSGMDEECRAGEMYCDSLAVEPEFQHRGIGRAMIGEFLRRSAASGLTATIVVEPDNFRARRLYESAGFSYDGMVFLLGHNYLRMTENRSFD